MTPCGSGSSRLWPSSPPRERRADLRGDVRVADDLEVVAPFRLVLQPQHPLRGAVGQLHVPLRVDDEDPFGHPAEDRLHAGAIRGELLRAAPDVANRLVEHARHRPDFVGAVIPRRTGEVAVRIAARRFGDGPHASAQEQRRGPREEQRRAQSRRGGDERRAAQRRELVADVRERQREANLADHRRRLVAHGDGDVQHLDVERGAVAPRHPEPVPPGLLHFGPVLVILDRAQLFGVQLRVADHGAVGGDEGDARRDQAAERIRLGVELRRRGRPAVRQRFGGEASFVDQRALDAVADAPPHAPRHHRHGHGERHRGRGEGAEEGAGAERHRRIDRRGGRRALRHRRACSRTA